MKRDTFAFHSYFGLLLAVCRVSSFPQCTQAHDTPELQYANEYLTGALMAFDMVVRLRARLMPKAKRE